MDFTPSDFDPAFSGDGTKIAFVSGRDGNSEHYTIDADGSEQTRLTNNPAIDQAPAWSPDGNKIVFQRTSTGNLQTEIFSMDTSATTNDEKDLTETPSVDEPGANWSPIEDSVY